MAKKKRLNEVTVLGKKFKIIYTTDMNPNDYGEMILEQRLIKINSNKPEDTWRSTLIHEIVHAGIGISGLSERISMEEEESFVVLMENIFEDFVTLT